MAGDAISEDRKNVDMNEQFHWQQYGTPWRGPAIYHITMAAYCREPLFAVLSGSPEEPIVDKTDLGWALIHALREMVQRHPEVKVLADQVMPNHLHLILQVTATMEQSIREVVRGYMQGCKAEARKLGREEPLFDGKPFYRPLRNKGQLCAMIDYTKANPRRAILRRQNPELFRLRRETVLNVNGEKLVFNSMGNHYLTEIPTRRMVVCSRSMTGEQIEEMKAQVLNEAKDGIIVYTAAISEGEKTIARAVREAGYPMVILLKDGFPMPGSEQEKYYKPGGVYFEACAEGRLLLLEATEDTFTQENVHAATVAALIAKAKARNTGYTILPTTSTRYRFMALNEMARMIVGSSEDEAR